MAEPIEEKHKSIVAALVETAREMHPGYGIVVLVFDFGDKGRMNYASNGSREDMICALKELVAKLEGRGHEPPDGEAS